MKNASELNKTWIKDYARKIMNLIGDGSSYRKKERMCWDMYHSRNSEDAYRYLVSYGDWDIPVKIRFTSIVRPNLEYLTSRYIGNPFNFSVMSVDKKSLEKKYIDKLNKYLDVVEDNMREKYLTFSEMMNQIEEKRQELEYILQQDPESEEEAEQLQELEKQAPIIMMKMNQMSAQIGREIEREAKKMDTVKMLGRLKAEDIREDLAHKKMKSMFEEDGILEEHRLSFVDKLVTGRPSIYVNIENGKLVYRQQPSIGFYHPRSTSIRYAEDLDWQAIDEYYPAEYVLSRWGNQMTEKEVKRIKNLTGYNEEAYYSGSTNASSYVEGKDYGKLNVGVRVTRIFWQYVAKNNYKISPSKGDVPHINRFSPAENLKKDERVETRYKSYGFECTVVNSDIYVDPKPFDEQVLKVDDYGWMQLPVVADSFDDVVRAPYSLVWVTKDLQALSTIIEYYKELLLVVSGVKGFIMDESQLPSGMGKNEWMYYRKLGVMWIETYKKDRRIQPNFNQFPNYDDTISAGIQYLIILQDRIQAQVDQITGVTRQARGEMESRDLVGTSQMAVQATSIIADVLFWEHDQVIRRALTRALNLYCKFISNNGDMFNIFDKYMGAYDIVEIPSGLLDGADYDIKVMNNNKDFRDVENLRQVIMNEYSKGTIDITGFVELMETQTLPEMKMVATHMVEKAEELRAQMRQGEREAEIELKQFEANLNAQLAEPMNQLKQLELQLRQLDLDLKNKQITFEEEFKNRQLESDNFLKALEIMTEREVELKYLDEQKQARQVNDILQQAKIITDVITSGSASEIERVSMIPKEKIKDKGHTLKN